MGLIYPYKDDYGSGNRGFVLRIPLETRDPALLQKVQSASVADPASYSIDQEWMEPHLCSLYTHSWRTNNFTCTEIKTTVLAAHCHCFWGKTVQNVGSDFHVIVQNMPRRRLNQVIVIRRMLSGAFAKLQKIDSQLHLVCLYVRPHGTSGHQLKVFSGNLTY